MFQNVVFLEISRSPLLTGVAGLPHSVCNTTKNELLTKFIKCALKLTENVEEVISTEIPYQTFTYLQTYVFLKLLKYVHGGVPFVRSRLQRVLYRITAPNSN